MAKQSKITVKHYLEKRLKLRDFTYPVYCYITFKRQTTKFKSFTGVYLSEIEFDTYVNNRDYNVSNDDIKNYEKDKKANDSVNSFLKYSNNTNKLDREIKAINYVLNRFISEKEIFENHFIRDLGIYFKNLNESIIEFCWYNYTNIKNEDFKNEYQKSKIYKNIDDAENKYNDFVLTFNQNNNLLDNIENIKKLTSIDVSIYFSKNILDKWKALKVILFLYSNSNIIDFIIDFDSNNLESESIDIKLKTIKSVFDEIFMDYLDYISNCKSIPF